MRVLIKPLSSLVSTLNLHLRHSSFHAHVSRKVDMNNRTRLTRHHVWDQRFDQLAVTCNRNQRFTRQKFTVPTVPYLFSEKLHRTERWIESLFYSITPEFLNDLNWIQGPYYFWTSHYQVKLWSVRFAWSVLGDYRCYWGSAGLVGKTTHVWAGEADINVHHKLSRKTCNLDGLERSTDKETVGNGSALQLIIKTRTFCWTRD